MNCWHCRNKLVWKGDFEFEDYALVGMGVVTTLACDVCGADVIITLEDKEKV